MTYGPGYWTLGSTCESSRTCLAEFPTITRTKSQNHTSGFQDKRFQGDRTKQSQDNLSWPRPRYFLCVPASGACARGGPGPGTRPPGDTSQKLKNQVFLQPFNQNLASFELLFFILEFL